MTTSKVSRLSQKAKERIRGGLIRSWQPGGTHRTKQQSRPVDADTLRCRALDDRRGQYLCKVHLRDRGEFLFLWSTTGRTDQVDVFLYGTKILTAAPQKAFAEILNS